MFNSVYRMISLQSVESKRSNFVWKSVDTENLGTVTTGCVEKQESRNGTGSGTKILLKSMINCVFIYLDIINHPSKHRDVTYETFHMDDVAWIKVIF